MKCEKKSANSFSIYFFDKKKSLIRLVNNTFTTVYAYIILVGIKLKFEVSFFTRDFL